MDKIFNTEIIDYILNFVKKSSDKDPTKSPFSFDDFVVFNPPLPETWVKSGIVDIRTKAIQKKNISIENLIANILKLTLLNINNIESTEGLKNNLIIQLGKDISRIPTIINEKKYIYNLNEEHDTSFNTDTKAIANKYIQYISNVMSKVSSPIDYNKLNIILLLTLQQIVSLYPNIIGRMLTHQITNYSNNSISAVIGKNQNNTSIIYTETTQKITYYYKAYIFIADEDGFFDSMDCPCGAVEYIFFIDLLKNTFGFSRFDVVCALKCGRNERYKCMPMNEDPIPELDLLINDGPISTEEESLINDGPISTEEESKKSNVNAKIAIAAGIGLAGLIATPLLLTSLGGNTKRKRRRRKRNTKTKTKKFKRSKKRKTKRSIKRNTNVMR